MNGAEKAAEQAVKATTAVRDKLKAMNSANKIENIGLRVITYGLLAVPIYFFVINVTPYKALILNITGTQWVAWLVGGVAWILGFILAGSAQFLEVLPFFAQPGDKQTTKNMRLYLSLGAYAFDMAVCCGFWSILGDYQGFPSFSDVLWINVLRIVAVVLGFGLWFMFRNVVRRAA